MLSFGAKNVKMHAFGKNPSLTKISISSLRACEQRGAPDWNTLKTWNFWGDRNLTNFSKIAFFEKWLQILKIVRGVKLRPKHVSFWTWTTRLYPTEQVVQSILQPEISTYFTHFRFECKQIKVSITRYSWEKCFPESVIKNLYWWVKRTEIFEIIGLVVLSTHAVARRNTLVFSHCILCVDDTNICSIL